MQEIKDVILARAKALESGDAAAVQAYHADEVVSFSLAPPLGGAEPGRDPRPLQAWIDKFDAPPRREVTALQVTTDGDVAFATSIDAMSASAGGDAFTMWYRVTLGLRRIEGKWLVTHEHTSVPFYMDDSFRAATDLKP